MSTPSTLHHLPPLLLLLLLPAIIDGVVTISITNLCPYTVWPAALPVGGGVQLDPGKTWTLNVPAGTSNGRVWARTGCSFHGNGNGSCQTGDCGGALACKVYGQTPNTIAKFGLGGSTDLFYISLVDGFNVPMDFLPVQGLGGTGCSKGPRCAANITSQCPSELMAPGGGGCNNACTVYKQDKYCCTGNGTNNCSNFFVRMCPDAYSYPKDDASKTFACPSGINYQVVFCPQIDLTPSPASPQPAPPAPVEIAPSPLNPIPAPIGRPTTTSMRSSARSRVLVILAPVAGFILLIMFFITIFFVCKRRHQETEEDEEDFGELQGTPIRFTFRQLQVATEQFRDKLGEGGFGSVFKGQFGEERIAVKRLDRAGQGKREFLAEVQTIGRIRHINLSQVITRMRGTPGYLAPEWLTSQITEKADVYSFGIVVMEIISGRKNLDTSRSEESIHLITLLEEKVKSDQLVDLIDKHSNDMHVLHKQEVIQMMKLAMWCLQIDCKRRPQMSEVVKVLEGTMNAETNIDHNFIVTSTANFGIAGNNVGSSDPPLASDVSGPR